MLRCTTGLLRSAIASSALGRSASRWAPRAWSSWIGLIAHCFCYTGYRLVSRPVTCLLLGPLGSKVTLMSRLRGLSAFFAQTSPNSRTYLRWCRSLPCSRGWFFHCYFRRWFSAFDFWACDRSFFFGFPVQLSSLNWGASILSCRYSSFDVDRCLNGFYHRHHSPHQKRHHKYLPSSRRDCCSARKWPATY